MSFGLDFDDLLSEFEKLIGHSRRSNLDGRIFFPTLYHYTNLSAFTGIIQGKELWSSEVSLLNDEKEYVFLSESVSRFFQSKKSLLDPGANFFTLLFDADVKTFFEEEFRKRFFSTNPNKKHEFIFSLSESVDTLSQWRAYAADGNGICIGFRSDFFETISNESQYLSQCYYLDYDEDSDFQDCLANIFQFLQLVPEPNKGLLNLLADARQETDRKSIDQIGPCLVSFLDLLEKYSSKVKNVSFAEENEWRFISKSDVHDKDVAFFATDLRMHMIKKIHLDMNINPIEEVWIGPGRHAERTEFVVKNMLKQSNMSNVHVIRSEIPYTS